MKAKKLNLTWDRLCTKIYTMLGSGFGRQFKPQKSPRSFANSFAVESTYRTFKHTGYLSGILTGKLNHNSSLLNYGIVLFMPIGKQITPSKNSYILRSAPVTSVELIGKYGEIEEINLSETFNLCSSYEKKLNLLVHSLDGFFIRGNLNQYFIPCSTRYKKIYSSEDTLITGYDIGKGLFTVIMYDRNGEFREHKVPMRNILEALISRYEAHQTPSGTPPKLGQVNSLKKLAVKSSSIDPCDKTAIFYQMRCHLKSQAIKRDSLRCSAKAWRNESESGVFGLATYDLLKIYFSNAISRAHRIDLRCSRLLWEHKRIMNERLNWMQTRKVKIPSLAKTIYEHLEHTTHRFHLLLVESKIKGKFSANLEPAGTLLEQKNLEKIALTEILSANGVLSDPTYDAAL